MTEPIEHRPSSPDWTTLLFFSIVFLILACVVTGFHLGNYLEPQDVEILQSDDSPSAVFQRNFRRQKDEHEKRIRDVLDAAGAESGG